jgi:hypothetical protein
LIQHPAVRARAFVTNYDRFFSQFARAGFDIGLAPLLNEPFYLAKSNNKFREYAACRIAGVYSDVAVYDCVQNGVTGLRVPNERGAWFDALARLIRDADLRARIQNQAQMFARAHYDQEKFARVWLEQINAVKMQAPRQASVPGASVAAREHAWIKLAMRVPRLAIRFAQSMRARGARRSLEMARWMLNDLSIFSWKWLGHG